MAKYPSLSIFTDAFISDTIHLSAAQTGAYIMLLMSAWRSNDCMLPNDDKILARMARMDSRTWTANKEVVMSFWSLSETQKWYQARLLDERKYVDEISNKNSLAGKASSLKRKERHLTIVQQNANKNPTPIPKPTPIIDTKVSIPDIIDPSDWQAYEEMRNKLKSPLTERAKQMAIKELIDFDKKGFDVNFIIRKSVMNNWKGVFEPKNGEGKKKVERTPVDRYNPYAHLTGGA